MNASSLQRLVLILLTTIAARGEEISMDDSDGSLGGTSAPVMATVPLTPEARQAARQGNLVLVETTLGSDQAPKAVQLLPDAFSENPSRLCWLVARGPRGKRSFRLQQSGDVTSPGLTSTRDGATGQITLSEGTTPVLRYNYAPVEPPTPLGELAPANRIYAKTRSDYIHPLFGFDGEVLTKDWSQDHPHHRGIYWAWPEVGWRDQLGDLHALQSVLAKPSGKLRLQSGPVFASIEAENVWQWESEERMVRERVVIRVYHQTRDGRVIDLELEFRALEDEVTLARRGTDHYGGLNIRMAAFADQKIVFHTDQDGLRPRRAWGELSGRPPGVSTSYGLVVLQHPSNPEYPGDWVEYPELNWFQPTFPSAGTRYRLQPGTPLVLRFRLWLRKPGGEPVPSDAWSAFHTPYTPRQLPTL